MLTVIGARPQFIKAATVSRVFQLAPGVIHEILVHTGQHFDDNMSDVFFRELEIPSPDYNLGIGSAGHGTQTGRMLEALEQVMTFEKPDWVMVYGDTNSTLAGALASVKLHIPVAHVEAGLRSFNRRMPEEVNRVLTDHASEILFAPTQTAVQNLDAEGIRGGNVHLVGDVMYDAALFYGLRADRTSVIIEQLGLSSKNYGLVTIHRAENTDAPQRLKAIVDGIVRIGGDVPLVMPLHPRTRAALQTYGMLEQLASGVRLLPPVGYLDMVLLEKHASFIVTDSGGVQKEAFFYEVPCATLREETEWVELVQLGWNRLVPPRSASEVFEGVSSVIGRRGQDAKPYGDGTTAKRIAQTLS